MKTPFSFTHQVETPAFVIDEDRIEKVLQHVKELKKNSPIKVLSALKPFVARSVMKRMAGVIDGFSASSLFEAKIAREVVGKEGTVHFTTPGLRPDEIEELGKLCDYITFNSLTQFTHLHKKLPSRVQCGLRINPEKSYVEDPRYDPCRRTSRLGVPLKTVDDSSTKLDPKISGVHFHTNCDSEVFLPLLETVKCITKKMGKALEKMKWINLGGGYLFNESADYAPLHEAVILLKEKFGLEVFIEPGAAFVRESVYLIASVIDSFDVHGKSVAILDTTVNHMPEVYEYQYEPDILNEDLNGKHLYLLGGSSCLAGDLFGEYAFKEPLEIGSRLIFPDMGAYTMVKAHMFNGINLPSIYLYNQKQGLRLKKRFRYEDFLAKIGE